VTIQTATAIVQRLGPCRIALDRTTYVELARELALMGCDVVDVSASEAASHGSGKTAGFLDWTVPDSGDAFSKALRRFATMDALVLQSAGQVRYGLEQALFEAGWLRHAAGMMQGECGAWSAYALPAISYYQRAPRDSADELRRSGVEADAAIARYAMAANHVRPGDHVLIDGDSSASGAAIVSALSRAGSIVRVDAASRPDSVEASLASLPDNMIDMIVALEPAVPIDWISRLEDYARVLKFDGRLVLGWRRSTGDNARPQGWEMLLEAVSEHFLPETRYMQMPVSLDPGSAHILFPAPLEQTADTDWLLLVASANPLLGESRNADYDHPGFPKAAGPRPALVDFGAAYDNPYLYRSMVQMGERVGHDLKLARLAECVIEDSREDSADRGAAIAVLGYRVLEMRLADLARSILPLIEAYLNVPLDEGTPVHVCRWRLSLAFLAGRLTELTGDRTAAKRWYRIAADAEWSGFSPLLATKSIAASFYEARLSLADGDTQTALACFRSGVDTALKAAACPHSEQIGPTDRPLPFYLQELAEVIDMGSQCANAVAHFPLWQRDPGLFWRQVDVRRFGLASWARDLERENERLRAA
jgi:hypothetical protein